MIMSFHLFQFHFKIYFNGAALFVFSRKFAQKYAYSELESQRLDSGRFQQTFHLVSVVDRRVRPNVLV